MAGTGSNPVLTIVNCIMLYVAVAGSSLFTFNDVLDLGLNSCAGLHFCTEPARNISKSRNHFCCEQCSCDPECVKHRDCCPDTPILDNYTLPLETTCTASFFRNTKSVALSGLKGQYTMYSVVDKCANGTTCYISPRMAMRYDQPFKKIVFVHSNTDGTIFQNRQCAECNNAKDIAEWNMDVGSCTGILSRSDIGASTFTSRVLNECFIVFNPPPNYKIRATCSNNVISTCKRGGRMLKNVCENPLSTFLAHITVNGVAYKNVYCLYCNHPEMFHSYRYCKDSRNLFVTLDQTITLNFNLRLAESTELNCRESEVYDTYTESCLPLTCPIFTVPYHGTCVRTPFLPRVSVFKVYIRMCAASVQPKWHASSSYSLNDVDIAGILRHLKASNCRTLSYQCLLFNKDLLEPNTPVINGLFIYCKLFLGVANCSILDIKYEKRDYNTVRVSINWTDYNYTMSLLEHDVELDGFEFDPLEKDYLLDTYRYTYLGKDTQTRGSMYQLETQSFCKYVTFSDAIYCRTFSTNLTDCHVPKGISEYFVQHTKHLLNKTKVVSHRICLSDYLNLISSEDRSDTISILGVISFSLTCSSLVCILTFLWSFLHEEKIRYNPRIFPMLSLVTLFLALASFQFGSGWVHVPVVCKTAGILTHYFWLCFVFTSNSYCFLVFKNMQNVTITTSFSSMTIALIVSFMLPLALIITNIIVSRVQGYGLPIGYGPEVGLCHISDNILRSVLFVLPIELAVILNIGLFVKIVVTIRDSASRMSLYGQSHAYFGTYLRLLCNTGIVWLIGFINGYIRSTVLSYIFNILTCGQGIIFLILYSCKTRKRKEHINTIRTTIPSSSFTKQVS